MSSLRQERKSKQLFWLISHKTTPLYALVFLLFRIIAWTLKYDTEDIMNLLIANSIYSISLYPEKANDKMALT